MSADATPSDTATMRAVLLEQEGDADVLSVRDVPVPRTPGADEVLVRVGHAALNHLDVWIRKGMPSVPKPRIMGADGMGEVVSVGADTGIEPRGRVLLEPSLSCGSCAACVRGETIYCPDFAVLGEHRSGTHAEYVLLPARNVHPVPPHLSDEEAAALPLTWCTAWRMLFTRANLRPGERVLVWGASAGVGSAAVQLARAAGAEVIATSRSADKLAACLELGAHHGIDTSSEDVVARVRELTGDGVDVVFDHLGQVAWKPSLDALVRGGRLVTCGATTGANPPASITRIFWKQLAVLGSTMASAGDFRDLLRFVTLYQLAPRVDRVFELEDIAEAHRYLETASQVGKVVLRVR